MIKANIRNKILTLNDRFDDLENKLSDSSILNDHALLRQYSQERSSLSSIIEAWQSYLQTEIDIEETHTLLDDPEMEEMAQGEINSLKQKLSELTTQINTLLLPKNPHDDNNILLEIRAGTGGNEASIFVGDLLRMYSRYAEQKRWKIEILSVSEGEVGGYKEVITRVIGKGAYSRLKFESGAHRVQRVPTTESQGRIHTSACTVAVMAEPDDFEEIEIDTKDLRIDTFRASGAGGQHVNKTDSAIRITHLPSGIVVECQQGRSQHQNKAHALTILQARLADEQQRQVVTKQTEERKSLVGSGDRSERIRTYNFPQGRVTDHRINLTEYKLLQVMEGSLDVIVEPLILEYQVELMAQTHSDF